MARPQTSKYTACKLLQIFKNWLKAHHVLSNWLTFNEGGEVGEAHSSVIKTVSGDKSAYFPWSNIMVFNINNESTESKLLTAFCKLEEIRPTC